MREGVDNEGQDSDRPVESVTEPTEPNVWRGTGAAPPYAANMAMRLMASGVSAREAAEALRRKPEDQ